MTAETVAPKKSPKKLLMAALPLALVAGGLWVWLASGRYESTENAAVQQARISVASQLSGRVTEVFIADNAVVKAGAPLFRVDPQPYELALAQAEASLAQARLGVEQLRAAWAAAVAQEKVAQDNADYLQSELERQQQITARGAGTQSALDAARHDASSALETLSAAKQNVAAALAALGGNPDVKTDDHPTVQAALVARDQAAYDLSQTTVKAPADGVVYKAGSFKTGQFVTAGASLFSLVETDDTWIEANFKETQIGHMAPGQKATIEFDAFPGRDYEAVLEAVGAGTGAEFSILPAQNATGNWVKVTQRVPVTLRLVPGSNLEGLRTGLSASVTVDTKAQTHLDALVMGLEATPAQAATGE
ncbi:membrane fusion protein (multidrug efflux system) [Rhodobacter aestuarii]|uniref:Membrane fusion protein, multidrug efflux system n=1 Tax=Rhodobacter aestuarii TaxID=453582 RepID=A0A1N7LSE2_9RHOB|nr:HlyD family secretion protein [Rhodobacter aestuarii]PTV95064.1 membrane fusion protein (multidrug efflux system) [Rhodobacter aestuarii]SIS76694.1 membrane fusion protein, multidrug efflux system [Rhodobacter aestuarii]